MSNTDQGSDKLYETFWFYTKCIILLAVLAIVAGTYFGPYDGGLGIEDTMRGTTDGNL